MDNMDTYYLMTQKPKSSLPRIFNHDHEFKWFPHRIYTNVWVIKTIYSEQAMWKYVFNSNSSMNSQEDILTHRILLEKPILNQFEKLDLSNV